MEKEWLQVRAIQFADRTWLSWCLSSAQAGWGRSVMKSMCCQREHVQVCHVHHTTTIPTPASAHEPHRSLGAVLGLEARSMRAMTARAAAAASTASWEGPSPPSTFGRPLASLFLVRRVIITELCKCVYTAGKSSSRAFSPVFYYLITPSNGREKWT